MSFGVNIKDTEAKAAADIFDTKVAEHKKHGGNAPTCKVMEALDAVTRALAEAYPGQKITVDTGGHLDDPYPANGNPSGYVNFKATVAPKNGG